MITAGVDLGTTFSLIAAVNEQGMPTLFPDALDAQSYRTPSVVHVGAHGCLVGQPVEDLLEEESDLPHVRFVKAKMGVGEGPVMTEAGGRPWSAQAISALILKKLKQDAASFEGDDVLGAVIAVPAQFGDAQRRATKEAALLADLPLVRLVEEPVAAATYYGLSESEAEQTLFVYDLGGGTFDATVLQATKEGLYVLATDGTAKVGGRDFDEAIMKAVAAEFLRLHKVDPLDDARARAQLRRVAEQMKVKLGKSGQTQARQAILLCGKTVDFAITRGQLERLIAPLVEETIAVATRCIEGAGLSWGLLDKVLLTGGSTLVPAVQERVKAVSGRSGERFAVQQPHQAVAFGAALVAAQAQGAKSAAPPLKQTIAGYDLGMRTWDKRKNAPAVEVLVRRNAPLPASARTTFYTTREDQTRVVFQLVQQKGEGEEPKPLRTFAFGPIAAPRKNYPVLLSITYGLDGTVEVEAKDPASGQSMREVVTDESQVEAARVSREIEQVRAAKINQ